MRFKKIIAVLLSYALLLSLCACGETDETKIAVIVKSVDSDFWQNFKSGVESAATEYNVSVTFEGPENEENYAEQNKMISRAAENGADVIVLSAIDRTRCAPTVNAAVRSGVRVIAADSALDSPLISLFIGTDNPESGISAAKALEAQFSAGEKIKLGIVGCSEKTENILKREEVLREYFAGLDNAEVVAAAAADSNIESAESKAAELLQKHPEINALIGRGSGNKESKCRGEDKNRRVRYQYGLCRNARNRRNGCAYSAESVCNGIFERKDGSGA